MESPAPHSGVTSEPLPGSEPASAESTGFEELESALGHRFACKPLLAQALTHRSLAYEQAGPDSTAGEALRADNERLEFLGDAVVGLVAAELLYRRYPELREGGLTRMRGALVSRKHLGDVAERLDLGKHLRLGRGEERSGGRTKRALLANAMEAVIGALYLDGGIDPVRRLIDAQVLAPSADRLREHLLTGEGIGDFKSALQERLQARKQGQPEYRTTGETGPDHRKRFFVEARAGGETLAEGTGSTRKIAEQDAARRALERLRSAEEEA
ncbi:MAG TPA: ribonuclease III [Acidobacteriaceae bacterium]|jgi:ribonuclease-3|nr:ribonuclease III [Acidobacteriaceae bacterium]